MNKDFAAKDAAGRWLTRSLIKEFADDTAPYSLDEMHDIYVESEDPTEHKAAMALLGSWEHWEAMTKCVPFKKVLEGWRTEMSVRIRSRAIMYIHDLALQPNGFQAARWLAEKGWVEKAAKGRPKKEDVDRAAREEADLRESVAADGARISLLRQ